MATQSPWQTSWAQNKWTHTVHTVERFASALSCILLGVMLDEKRWAELWRTLSSTYPSISSLTQYLQRFDRMFASAGKSATRGAETESWRTCMKMIHSQSAQTKLTHGRGGKGKKTCRNIFVKISLPAVCTHRPFFALMRKTDNFVRYSIKKVWQVH